MAHLGSFDVAARALDPDAECDTFDLCGQTFRIASDISTMSAPLLRFADAATEGGDTDEFEGLAALKRAIDLCVHPEDVTRFWACAESNRVPGELLVQVMGAIIQAATGRPTQPPVSSSPGSRATTGSSSGGSSSPGTPPRLESSPLLAREPGLLDELQPISLETLASMGLS